MEIVLFDERTALNGWRVRIRYSRGSIWPNIFGYDFLEGMTGTIVARPRLPWVDRLKRPYKTLPIMMDKPVGCSSNVAHMGVHDLELIGWGPCPHQFLAFQGHIAAPGYGQSWACADCGEAMWSIGGASVAVPYSSLPDGCAPELTMEEIA